MHLITITLCLFVVLFSCCSRCCVNFQINTFPIWWLHSVAITVLKFSVFLFQQMMAELGKPIPKRPFLGTFIKLNVACMWWLFPLSPQNECFFGCDISAEDIYFKQLCFESRNFDLALKSGKLNFISVIEQESLYMVNWYWASFVFCWVGNSSSFNKPNQLRMEDITIPQGNI